MKAWKPILAALLIFTAGVMAGGLTVHLTGGGFHRQPSPPTQAIDKGWPARRSEADVRDLVQRLQRRLKLTPQQREHIEAIVKESRERMRTIAEEMAPRTREEFHLMRERIREELAPEQRRDFEEVFKQREGPRRHAPAEALPRPPERP